MTSEVTYDLGIELLDLDNLCSHVSVVPNCHQSQKFTTFHTLLLPLKPCQEGPLTSRASLGSKNLRETPSFNFYNLMKNNL